MRFTGDLLEVSARTKTRVLGFGWLYFAVMQLRLLPHFHGEEGSNLVVHYSEKGFQVS